MREDPVQPRRANLVLAERGTDRESPVKSCLTESIDLAPAGVRFCLPEPARPAQDAGVRWADRKIIHSKRAVQREFSSLLKLW